MAIKQGKNAPGTLNAANEVAVDAFLNNKIGFLDISRVIETTLNETPSQNLDTLASVVENDQLSRQLALSLISKND